MIKDIFNIKRVSSRSLSSIRTEATGLGLVLEVIASKAKSGYLDTPLSFEVGLFGFSVHVAVSRASWLYGSMKYPTIDEEDCENQEKDDE